MTEQERQDKLNEILGNLEKVNLLKAEFKRRSMIFDCHQKEMLAELKGLPLDTFYYLPYKIWTRISHRLQRNWDTLTENYYEFQDYCQRDLSTVPRGDYFKEFGYWAKQNGLYWY